LRCRFGQLACRLFSRFTGAGFLLFTHHATLGQLFFLATDQLGLAACIFFATSQFDVVNQGELIRIAVPAQVDIRGSIRAVISRRTKVRFLRTST
jgi:hypothetical protein